MDRKKALHGSTSDSFFDELTKMHQVLDDAFLKQFQRSLPMSDEILDRWERARKLGFGEESSIYDSSYVFGQVEVGKKTWIGPFTIIDGSGNLSIGNHCTISAGVHIYTHDNVAQTLTGGIASIEREPVRIGDCTYIGPNAVIKKGVTIGAYCIVGTGSFITQSIPSHSVAVGTPGKIIGTTRIEGGKLTIQYLEDRGSFQNQ